MTLSGTQAPVEPAARVLVHRLAVGQGGRHPAAQL